MSTAYANLAGAYQYSSDYVVNYNQAFATPGASGDGSIGNVGGQVSLASIDAASSLIMVMENNPTGTGNYGSNWDIDITNSAYTAPGGTPDPAHSGFFAGHSGMTNYLYVDGHVKSLRPFATLSQRDGGSGSINMWVRNNKDFADSPVANDLKNARTFLADTANNYK